MTNMTKQQLGLFIAVVFSLGYLLGQNNSTTEAVVITKTKTNSEILKCREEVEELKSQCTLPKEAENKIEDNTQASIAGDSNSQTSWLKLGKRALDIAFESDVKEFLKQVEVPNLFDVLKIAKVVGEDQLKVLNGKFAGNVVFDDRGKDNWDVEMTVNGTVESEEPKGDKIIALSKNGKVFSRTTGRGRIKDVYTMGEDSTVILAEVNGDDGYIQMYYLPRLEMFTGNYYVKTSVGQFERQGTVSLKRAL